MAGILIPANLELAVALSLDFRNGRGIFPLQWTHLTILGAIGQK
jgi:hypothetical protein